MAVIIKGLKKLASSWLVGYEKGYSTALTQLDEYLFIPSTEMMHLVPTVTGSNPVRGRNFSRD